MAFPDYEDSLPVHIDTLRFEMDLAQFSWTPISSIRDAVDQSGEPGEQSIVPTGLWKRSRGNWTMGQGQDYGDEPGDSEELQYFQSLGIDPWDQRTLKLLPDVERKGIASGATNKLIPVDDRVYWLVAGTLRYDTSPESGSFTSQVTGNFVDITQYGNKLVAATGLGTSIVDGGTATALGSDATDYVLYGNGRLLGMHDNELFEISSAGVKTSLWTHPNTDFVWKGGVSAPNGLYVFGTAGETSEIFFLGIDDVSAALFPPYTAAPLTPNEEVHALYHYGGIIVIGTNRGFRVANITGNGHLSYGPLVEVGAVYDFAGDGEDLWFTWTSFVGTHSGLGRARLDKGPEPLVPRYATDIMTQTASDSQTVCSYNGRRYFALNNGGLFGATADKISTGWYNSGWMTFGVADLKELHSLDVRHEPLPAGSSVVGKIIKEDASNVTVVTSDTLNAVGKVDDVSPRFTAEQVQIRVEMNRATDTTVGPELHRWTLRAIPMPVKQSRFILPLMFKSKVKGGRGQIVRQDALTLWNSLRTLEANRTIVTVKIGNFEVSARVDGVGINPGGAESWAEGEAFVEGTVMVALETAGTLGS